VPPRLKKWLKRLTFLVVILAVIGVAGFTWFAYWPLEGDVDDLMALVPYDAEFVVRGRWEDLEKTGWIERNVEDAALHPLVQAWRDGTGEFRTPALSGSSLPAIRSQIDELERQINAQIPLSTEWATFGVEKDLLRGEIAIAGMWCEDQDPRVSPPAWQEILVLKRVTWRPRLALAALDHGFVRDQVLQGSPDLRGLEDVGDKIYKLTLAGVRVSSERDRSGCGRGFVMPPENEWFVRRVKDVVAFSNSQRMITKVAELTKEGSGSDSFAARPGFETQLDPEGVVAAANLQPLARYLIRFLERRQDRLKVLERFLRPRSLEKMNGGIDLDTPDLVKLGGRVTYVPREAGEIVDAMYKLAPRPVAEGIATMVPARTTFAAAFLRCDPTYLLKAIFEEAISPEELRLLQGNLQRMRRQGVAAYPSVDDFVRDVASRMDDTATLAIGRLDEYDAYPQDNWWADDQPKALAAYALMVKLREGASPDEVDSFLAEKIPLLGFEGSASLERATHRGVTYTHMIAPKADLNDRHLEPAYVVVSGHLVLSNSESYLKQILDTIADGAASSLAGDETFRVTMRALPSAGQAALFMDLEKLSRIPPAGNPKGRPWGFLWDMRNQVVRERNDDREVMLRVREKEEARYPKPLTREQSKAVNAAIDRAVEDLYDGYPQKVEEYRQELEGLRRLRSVGAVVLSSGEHLELRTVLALRDAEPDVGWARGKN